MKNEKKQAERLSLAFLFVVIVLALWSGSWGLMKIFIEPQDRGQFGDQFGAVNALFSGLAFAALVYTIYLQRIEIRQTQDEMKEQNQTFALQTFESSFFSLLSQHNELINNIRRTDMTRFGPDQKSGKILIEDAYVSYGSYWALRGIVHPNNSQKIEMIENIFASVYTDFNFILGSYFRSLYRIFKFIDESNVINKKFYTDIVRSQFSDSELCLLYFNGLTNRGKKFKFYIERYALLNNLPLNKIHGNPMELYDVNGAYGVLDNSIIGR